VPSCLHWLQKWLVYPFCFVACHSAGFPHSCPYVPGSAFVHLCILFSPVVGKIPAQTLGVRACTGLFSFRGSQGCDSLRLRPVRGHNKRTAGLRSRVLVVRLGNRPACSRSDNRGLSRLTPQNRILGNKSTALIVRCQKTGSWVCPSLDTAAKRGRAADTGRAHP